MVQGEEDGDTPIFINDGETQLMLQQMRHLQQQMEGGGQPLAPASSSPTPLMVEGQGTQPSMAMAQKLSGAVCVGGVQLDPWGQFTPPPPAQITFASPTQILAQMSQEANCFIRMGETQNGVLLRMGQLEKWVAEKIAGKITQEEMEEYLRLGMREVEMLRQQSEQALTQVNS